MKVGLAYIEMLILSSPSPLLSLPPGFSVTVEQEPSAVTVS